MTAMMTRTKYPDETLYIALHDPGSDHRQDSRKDEKINTSPTMPIP
jgi:hypothetical protein